MTDTPRNHVYRLRSIAYPNKYYKGYSSDVVRRLREHNRVKVRSTAAHKPWKLQTVISFDSVEKAQRFEQYLKFHAGRAFSSKHF